MKKIKYIYFEINQITGINSTNKKIENENVLLIKPKTNSSGIEGYTNMTERKGFSKPTFSVVNQYWINLEKFNKENHYVYKELKKYVSKVHSRLIRKINLDKLKKDVNFK